MSTSNFLVLLVLITSIYGEKWTQIVVGPWEKREGLMGCVYNDWIYISGGRDDKIMFNDVYRLNGSCYFDNPLNTDCQWELLTQNAPWLPRAYHLQFVHNDYIYIMGGQNFTPVFYNDVWRTKDGIHWESVAENTNNATIRWHGRAGLGAISFNNEIIVAGGAYNNDTFGIRTLFNDVWSSSDGKEWIERMDSSPWLPRDGPRIIVYENTLYLTAGEDLWSEFGQFNDIWKMDKNYKWTLIKNHTEYLPRSGLGFLITNNGSMYVLAGYYGLHDLWRSDNFGESFYEVLNNVWNCDALSPDNPKCGRYDFWSLLYNDKLKNITYIYTFGGDSDYSTFGGEHNDTWRYPLIINQY